MIRLLLLILVSFFFVEINSQEKPVESPKERSFKSGVGVVDMKKILQDSTAYQALVDQFEEKRRKHRNKFTMAPSEVYVEKFRPHHSIQNW